MSVFFNAIRYSQRPQLTENGIHCTVAAVSHHADRWREGVLSSLQGNEGRDAVLTSPANAIQAITVGATDITDSMARYSNFGAVVDVFAPGTDVISTWIDGGYRVLSGTSMATPAVAGTVARFLIIIDRETPPAEMSRYISQMATKDALSNIRKQIFVTAVAFLIHSFDGLDSPFDSKPFGVQWYPVVVKPTPSKPHTSHIAHILSDVP